MTAAATAAGFKCLQSDQRREYREREFGKVCPDCFERIPFAAFETHVLMVHATPKEAS